jgi:ubiquinone/menaquinone biosynthesis C-methylase UbiE
MSVSDSAGGYDDGYRACKCFWGTQPSSLIVEQFAECVDLSGRSVLDAGCGEGKNAIFLARKGASVVAIDVSSAAIANAKRAWPDYKRVDWVNADVRDIGLPDDSFDIVIAYGLLHCLDTEDALTTTVGKLKRATKADGLHIVCAFNVRQQDLTAHPGFHPTLLSHDRLLSLYDDWLIVSASDSDLFETHPHNHIAHNHSLTRFVARRR